MEYREVVNELTGETKLVPVKSTAHGNPTEGRVYGGDGGLVHIADGDRAKMGKNMATILDSIIRAEARGITRSEAQLDDQDLCPGCYMVAGFNMLVELAKRNNQSLSELGRTMAQAFEQLDRCAQLGNDVGECIEHIDVMLDGEPG